MNSLARRVSKLKLQCEHKYAILCPVVVFAPAGGEGTISPGWGLSSQQGWGSDGRTIPGLLSLYTCSFALLAVDGEDENVIHMTSVGRPVQS